MNMMYDQDDAAAITDLLLYRKVTKVSDTTLLLDNGIELEFEANSGCGGCNSGWYDIKELNGCDNAITNVELVCEEVGAGWEAETSYKIFVLTEDKRITLAQVDGDDGNGYYGTGYVIHARLKGDGSV